MRSCCAQTWTTDPGRHINCLNEVLDIHSQYIFLLHGISATTVEAAVKQWGEPRKRHEKTFVHVLLISNGTVNQTRSVSGLAFLI